MLHGCFVLFIFLGFLENRAKCEHLLNFEIYLAENVTKEYFDLMVFLIHNLWMYIHGIKCKRKRHKFWIIKHTCIFYSHGQR